MGALTEQDARMLAKILGRLGSDFDGERATAGAIASRFIRSRKLSWDDVLAIGGSTGSQHCHHAQSPRPTRSNWHPLARACLEIGEDSPLVTQWETDFLENILRWS